MTARALLVIACCALAACSTPGHATPPLIGQPADWLNTGGKPVRIEPGKVYLIDFWEYTCVNCIRTLPYLRAWNERYAKDGLVIVGIHTPEFAFAHDRANVEAAVRRLGITYPVLVDSDYRNWNVWQGAQGYWPRHFLIDANGRIVDDHAGEGGYAETEGKIQKLLHLLHPNVRLPLVMAPVRAEDREGAVCYPVTQEMYAGGRGFQQGQLGNVAQFSPGDTGTYRLPAKLEDGRFYPDGRWRTEAESLRHARATTDLADSVSVRYHALGCNAVVRPEDGAPLRLYVWQDDKPVPKQDAGEDIRYDDRGRSYAQVEAPRMYALTRNRRFGAHILRLASDSAAFGLYSLTFTSCVTP